MYKILLFLLAGVITAVSGYSQHATVSLSAIDFAKKIQQTPDAQIVDVRSPEEFQKGHLKDALNINWNGAQFQDQIKALDRSKPVFIYCLSGGRSAAAAESMSKQGYTSIYEMDGGMMKWRAANLPEVMAGNVSEGMTLKQYESLLKTGKLVLVDFYADWCAPCKKMKPYLEKIAKEQKDQLTLIRINVDENKALCKALQVTTLPVLKLYQNQKVIWDANSLVAEPELRKVLSSQKD